jgi:uncharacterized membrane protein
MAAYTLDGATLDCMEAILRDRYVSHEISADEYTSALEDLRIVRKGKRS